MLLCISYQNTQLENARIFVNFGHKFPFRINTLSVCVYFVLFCFVWLVCDFQPPLIFHSHIKTLTFPPQQIYINYCVQKWNRAQTNLHLIDTYNYVYVCRNVCFFLWKASLFSYLPARSFVFAPPIYECMVFFVIYFFLHNFSKYMHIFKYIVWWESIE